MADNSKHRGKLASTKCLYCHQEFLVRQAEIDRGNGKFCSRNHHFEYRKTRPKTHKVL